MGGEYRCIDLMITYHEWLFAFVRILGSECVRVGVGDDASPEFTCDHEDSVSGHDGCG